jgi:outer membrane receptor protein involved in Fe transport
LGTVADFSVRRDRQITRTENVQSAPDPAIGVLDDNRNLDRGKLIAEIVNAHLGLDYKLSSKTQLSGGLRFAYFHGRRPSADAFEQDGDTGTPITAFTRQTAQQGTQYNGSGTATLRHDWTTARNLVLTGTYDWMQFDRHRFDLVSQTLPVIPDTTATFDRHTHYHQLALTADYETLMPGKARLKLGYAFDSSSTHFGHAAATGTPRGAMIADPSQTGIFLDDEDYHQIYATYQRPFGKLDALIGLRAERLHLALDEQTRNVRSSQNYDRLYPSLHLSYAPSDRRKLTASYARRVDRPSYALLDSIPYPQNPGFVFVGNASLRPQDTDSFELGYETGKDASSFLATLYYRQTHHAFSYLYALSPGGTLTQTAVNAGEQRNGGLELVLGNRLARNITYSVSADGYWSQLESPSLGFTRARRAATGFGRANLNWQLTRKDFLQLNVFVNGETLLPQGHVAPFASGNIGFRHSFNNGLSALLVIQDPFDSVRTRQVLNGIGGVDRRLDTANNRMASLTLVWNFSGKRQNADFDFKPGGYGETSAP